MTEGGGKTEKSRARRWSRGLAQGALIAFTALIIGVAVTGAWLRAIAFDEERFKDTIAPLGSNDEVQTALGLWAGAELRAILDLKPYLEDVLPERAEGLAGPIEASLEFFLAERAQAFFESDTFSDLWTRVTVRAHAAIVKVLEGNSEALDLENGAVTINLVPILSKVLEQVETEVSAILGRDIDIPEIGPGTPASESINQLADALGRSLPEDFGQLKVFEEDRLDLVQVGAEWFNRLVVLFVIAGIALVALAIYVAPNKRRTILWLALSSAFIIILLRRITFVTQSEIVDSVRKEQNVDAVDAIVDQLFGGFRTMTAVILGLCVLAAIGTMFNVDLYRRHAEVLQYVVAGALALILLFGNLGWLALLVLLVLTIAIEVALTQLRRSSPAPEVAV